MVLIVKGRSLGLPCNSCVIHTWALQRRVLTMGRYTNPASFTFYIFRTVAYTFRLCSWCKLVLKMRETHYSCKRQTVILTEKNDGAIFKLGLSERWWRPSGRQYLAVLYWSESYVVVRLLARYFVQLGFGWLRCCWHSLYLDNLHCLFSQIFFIKNLECAALIKYR